MFHIVDWKDCYYRLDQNRFVVGNNLIERSWNLTGQKLTPGELTDKLHNRQWFASGNAVSSESYSQAFTGSPFEEISIAAAVEDRHGLAAEHWRLSLLMRCGPIDVKLIIILYPELPIIRTTLLFRANPMCPYDMQPASSHASSITGLTLDNNNTETGSLSCDYIDALPLELMHGRWRCTMLRDVTDTNNNLVHVESGLLYPNEKLSIRGNAIVVNDLLSPNGLTIVKEAPTSYGHLHDSGSDFQFIGRSLFVQGSGVSAKDLESRAQIDDGFVHAYGTAVGVWSGSESESLQWLYQYVMAQRPIEPNRDTFIMSNTWGDRSKDARICESFILEELHAAAKLGITHLQIDDGWQSGITMNSIRAAGAGGGRWGSYYDETAGFWSVHPERFPNGFHSIMSQANEYGIRIGLWFSPDSTNDYSLWRQDADTLLALHAAWGIDYFKLDGIHLRSKLGESNLLAMMDAVTKETGGKVYFNMDATAETRFGYLSDMPYGGIFLENRYTDWGNYYPHWTLRNLWQLAKWIPAQKLQMEVLNVERNGQRYLNDPLAPAACGIAYSFAVTIMSNPLMWMELSSLSSDSAAILSALIRRYRLYQQDLAGGHVLPIGDEPSGTGWTGFQSVIDASRGYVLVFREFTPNQSSTMQLWNMPPDQPVELLHIFSSNTQHEIDTGDHRKEMTTDATGGLTFSLPAPFTFALYRYQCMDRET